MHYDQRVSKPKKEKPPRDQGYYLKQRCPRCGGSVRTWLVGVREETRHVSCFTCWRDFRPFELSLGREDKPA